MFSRLYKVLRIYDYYGNLEILMYCGLIYLLANNLSSFTDLAFFLGFIFTIYAYAFVINTVIDRQEDLAVGKERYRGFSPIFVHVLMYVLLVASVLIGVVWFSHILSWALYAGVVILATAYSIPPLRLKNRLGGLLYVLVIALMFNVFVVETGVINYPLIIFINLWLLLKSLKRLLKHYVLDFENDITTGFKTFVIRIGKARGKNY